MKRTIVGARRHLMAGTPEVETFILKQREIIESLLSHLGVIVK